MGFSSAMQLFRDLATIVFIIIMVVAITYGFFSWQHQKANVEELLSNGSVDGEVNNPASVPLIGSWFGNGRTCYSAGEIIDCGIMDAMVRSEYNG